MDFPYEHHLDSSVINIFLTRPIEFEIRMFPKVFSLASPILVSLCRALDRCLALICPSAGTLMALIHKLQLKFFSYMPFDHCAILIAFQSEARPKMYVFNTVTGETLPVTGNECLLHTSVAKLKTIVSVQSGLPVSSFRLSTAVGVQLYDCNWLQDYNIERGTTNFLSVRYVSQQVLWSQLLNIWTISKYV